MKFEVRNLSFAYEKGKNVLNGVSFSLESGRAMAICGSNGSGKSTLIKILSGIIPVFQKGKLEGKAIGFGDSSSVLQEIDAQFICDRGEEEFSFFKRYSGAAADWKKWFAMMKAVEIAGKKTDEMSSGEKQRFLVAMALSFAGKGCLLLDEPGAYLDRDSRKELARSLSEIKREGAGIIFAGHDFSGMEHLFDSVWRISGGELSRTDGFPVRKLDFSKPLPPGEEKLSFERLSVSVNKDRKLSFTGRFHLSGREICGLSGGNGEGKTTLCRALCSYFPSEGLSFNGRGKAFYVSSMPQNQLMGASPEENIRFFSGGEPEKNYLDMLGIERIRGRNVGKLSYGEMQKVLLACALSGDADILVIDEPLLSLDSENLKNVFAALREFSARGGSVLITSHSPELLETLCSRIYVLKNGALEEMK